MTDYSTTMRTDRCGDLRITDVSIRESSPSEGDSITIDVTVINSGPGKINQHERYDVEFSLGTTFTSSVNTGFSDTSSSGAALGQSQTTVFSFIYTMNPGQDLTFIVDNFDSVPETDEGNNSYHINLSD